MIGGPCTELIDGVDWNEWCEGVRCGGCEDVALAKLLFPKTWKDGATGAVGWAGC